MITCNFCGIDQPNRALAAHQTTSASCLTIQLKTALARTDAAEKERDDARGALAVETRNANRLAHDRDAAIARAEAAEAKLAEEERQHMGCDTYGEQLKAERNASRAEVERLRAALRPLAQIADMFDDSRLDEHRPEWGAKDPKSVELLTGRGGGLLLSLDDALTARAVLAAEVKP